MKFSKIFLRIIYEIKRVATGKPFIAEVDITDRCNLRCSHCYHFQEKGDAKGQEEPSVEKWRDRFSELHKKGIRMIMLMGGEPMLRPDIVQLADEMFPFVEMITNGTIPVPEKYQHRIFVSIDGMKKTNDSIRGEGVFDKVVNNFSGDKRAVFNMTLSGDNFKELQQVVELSEKIGISGVVCNIYTALDSNSKSRLEQEIREKIIETIKEVKKKKPAQMLITAKALDWFEKGDHRDKCYWSEKVLHYDINWNNRPCFAVADCSNCGCFAGAMGSPLGSFGQFKGLLAIMFHVAAFRISKFFRKNHK